MLTHLLLILAGATAGAIAMGIIAGGRQYAQDRDARRMEALRVHGAAVWTGSGLMLADQYADRLIESENN